MHMDVSPKMVPKRPLGRRKQRLAPGVCPNSLFFRAIPKCSSGSHVLLGHQDTLGPGSQLLDAAGGDREVAQVLVSFAQGHRPKVAEVKIGKPLVNFTKEDLNQVGSLWQTLCMEPLDLRAFGLWPLVSSSSFARVTFGVFS